MPCGRGQGYLVWDHAHTKKDRRRWVRKMNKLHIKQTEKHVWKHLTLNTVSSQTWKYLLTDPLAYISNRHIVPYFQGKWITGKPTLVFLADLFPRAFSSRVSALMRSFFSPRNKSWFHTTSRRRLHKQTDGEGDGERASVSRQHFTHSALCYAGRNCTRIPRAGLNSWARTRRAPRREARCVYCSILHGKSILCKRGGRSSVHPDAQGEQTINSLPSCSGLACWLFHTDRPHSGN